MNRKLLINSVSADEIENFIYKIDKLFPTPISNKTDISTYSNKLYDNGLVLTMHNDNNEIIGMLCGYINNKEIAYMSILGVLQEYQGNGIAKELVCKFLEIAKNNKNKLVHLYAVESNRSAMNLYNKLGFTRYIVDNEERPDDIHLCKIMEDK